MISKFKTQKLDSEQKILRAMNKKRNRPLEPMEIYLYLYNLAKFRPLSDSELAEYNAAQHSVQRTGESRPTRS